MADLVRAAIAERARLLRRLEALNGVIAAYEGSAVAYQNEIRTRDRFSQYGSRIVGAVCEIVSQADAPIPTRVLVGLLRDRGVDVRGVDQANALSALLARSSELQSQGRRGWLLATPPKTVHDHPAQELGPQL